jgi:hypothetical protein
MKDGVNASEILLSDPCICYFSGSRENIRHDVRIRQSRQKKCLTLCGKDIDLRGFSEDATTSTDEGTGDGKLIRSSPVFFAEILYERR